MWLEGRVYLEYLRLIRDPVFRGVEVPPGLGRPVMLIMPDRPWMIWS